MQLHSLMTAVGLAATTNALLLPPDFPISENDVITTLPVPTKIDVDVLMAQVPETQTLALKCPGCLLQSPRGGKEIPSHLKLDFSIESLSGADRLTVNGFELYPNPASFHEALVAPVLPDLGNRHMGVPPRVKGGLARPQSVVPLGFGMQTQPALVNDEEDDLQLINIELQIVEVGNVFIEDIPNVHVKLLKTSSGKLAIGNIDTIASPVGVFAGDQKVCSSMLCKWKTILFKKLALIINSKGCGSRPGGPTPQEGERPQHGGWGQFFMVFASHILLPMVLGLAAGLTACFVGMMLGYFVALVSRKVFPRSGTRSSHRCRYAHKAAKSEDAVEDEKFGLMNHQEDIEAPPAYVDEGLVSFEDNKSENAA